MIEVKECSLAYDGIPVLQGVSCQIRHGEIYGIIGPNGSGKSTLLKMISGLEQADYGSIQVEGKAVSSYSRKRLAQFMAVLEQEVLPAVGFTVREVVEMGRYPHQDWLGRERRLRNGLSRLDSNGGLSGSGSIRREAGNGVDVQAEQEQPLDVDGLIDGIMERLGLTGLADRTLDQISGGERQRAALGKAMVQEPRLLLLDEPTTYLDIGYQLQMMDYVKKWNKENGLTVVAVLHDLNLAAQYCDRLMVMKEGIVVAEGKPWDIIREDLIEAVYGTKPVVVQHPATGAPQVLLKSALE
jgi:iron complex transport system ATP-binding protein